MRAIVQRKYGPPEAVLELRDVARPAPGDDKVLVRVRAASVHPDVWHVVLGRPRVLRVMGAGLFSPRVKTPGTDIAGQIEAVGKNVTKFQPGDEVFGEIVTGHQWKNGGAYAEYAAAPAAKLETKPDNLTFEQAAAVPTSGLIAYQGIRRDGRVENGEKVLVNGAGGAVGSFAVQLAKALGAEVTAVDNSDKQDLLRSIGADHVVDYTREDFTDSGQRYDFILDIPGNRSFEDLKRALVEGGRYVLIGHDNFGAIGGRWFGGTIGRIIKLEMKAPFGRAKQPKIVETKAPLLILKELVEAGKITPAVDRIFDLSEVPQAIAYVASGQVLGKAVITI